MQILRSDNDKEYLSEPFNLLWYNIRFSIRSRVLIHPLRIFCLAFISLASTYSWCRKKDKNWINEFLVFFIDPL